MIKINKEDLRNFLLKHTNEKAAKHFGVGQRTIARRRKEFNLSHHKVRYNAKITSQQMECLDGSMLGDGSISHLQHRFAIKQRFDRGEYLQYLFDSLLPFSIYLKSATRCRQLLTCTHPIFTQMRQRWYEGKQKIVPKDLVLTPRSFAHWFVEDGSNNQKKRSLRISTNCFRFQDVEFLVEILFRDLGVKATINKQRNQPVLHIGAYEYFRTIEILKPLILWPCFLYKTDTSRVPPKRNPNMGTKLNLRLAREIRSLHLKSHAAKDLAKLYGVGLQSIYSVLNYITHKDSLDKASISVIYNP